MIIDSTLEFSVDQTLTTTATASANVIDLTTARNIGPGRPMWVTVQTIEELEGGTSYVATIQTSDNESSGYTDIASVALKTEAGALSVVGFPYTNKRYLRLNYTFSGSGTGGKVSASLTDQEPRSWQPYPAA